MSNVEMPKNRRWRGILCVLLIALAIYVGLGTPVRIRREYSALEVEMDNLAPLGPKLIQIDGWAKRDLLTAWNAWEFNGSFIVSGIAVSYTCDAQVSLRRNAPGSMLRYPDTNLLSEPTSVAALYSDDRLTYFALNPYEYSGTANHQTGIPSNRMIVAPAASLEDAEAILKGLGLIG